MGHRASYVIVRDGVASGYNDQWGAMGVTDVFATGPDACEDSLADYTRDAELLDDVWAEGGFLIDFDSRIGLVFGLQGSGYGGWEDGFEGTSREYHEAAKTADAILAEDPARWIEHIAPLWPGFELRFVDDVNAFTAHLDEHGLSLAPADSDDDEGADNWPVEEEDELLAPFSRIVETLPTDRQRRALLGLPGGARPSSSMSLGSVAFLVLALPIALVVRLVTAPLRWLLGVNRRKDAAGRASRREHHAKVVELTRRLERDPKDVQAIFERGMCFVMLNFAGPAEAAFDACVRLLEAEPHPEVQLSSAVFNRGTARIMLGADDLGKADHKRADELGFTEQRKKHNKLLGAVQGRWMMFRYFAGW